MTRTVTLVDEEDNAIGTAEIVDAHTGKGKLHRAFSVYVFNDEHTKMLIQKRCEKKMLWPMFWANTCCSHPFEGETPAEAGERRLNEELGILCELEAGPAFVYRALDPAGRGVEHEHVTTLIGNLDEGTAIKPDPNEVAAWKWMGIAELTADMKKNPDIYAPWFHLGLPKVLAHV